MKLFTFISGALSISLLVLGILFKIQHWNLGGEILILGSAIFSLVFVPLAAKYLYDKDKH